MKNVLKRFEEDEGTQFFVMKSYVTAAFETDRKKDEYHIFYVKKNSVPDAYHCGYMNLKIRKMNRVEVEHFMLNMETYKIDLKNEDGIVYNLATKPFDKSLCPSFKQFVLNL